MKILFNNEVSEKNINQSVTLYGWVDQIRKLGKIIFINLRDSSTIIQLIVKADLLSNTNISKESIIKIVGKVQKRKTPNPKMETGAIEIDVKSLCVLSTSKALPFELNDTLNVKEDMRIKHRYLDLRSRRMLNNLGIRHKTIFSLRKHLNDMKFLEIETPMLTKPTPEGARDYLVPTRFSKKATFFSLPQSPQMYKQLLMISGMERYFQITKVFRDEDLRSDRQFEFTQLDMELSFTEPIQIQKIIEKLMYNVFKDLNLKVKTPFTRMKFQDALNMYGTDKPDLRYEQKLHDETQLFEKTNFNHFKNKEAIKFIFINETLNKKQKLVIEEIAKKNGDTKVAIIEIHNNVVKNPIYKFIKKEIDHILKKYEISNGTIFIVADTLNKSNISLGAIRVKLNEIFKYAKEGVFEFLWIEDWPLFEYNEIEKKYLPSHHPFTSPTKECINNFENDLANAKAIAYDLVLNGYEIGSGSIRINDINIQDRIFKALGLTKKEIKDKFGFFLDAFQYGVPPHGGIALGLDRFIMIINNEKSIREVIAFPKNSKGYDPLIDAPTTIDENILKEYNLKFK